MSDKDENTWFECYKKAEEEISRMYPVFCVCGSLCTSLHEMRCKKFQSVVREKAKDLYENRIMKEKENV